MRRRGTSKSSLFLLELMISMVFFAIAATGCVQIFAKAHLLSEQAEELNLAVSIAQSVADTYHDLGKTVWNYDACGNECEAESAIYQAQIQASEQNGMMHLDIDVVQNGQEEPENVIYHLETDVYPLEQTGGKDE